jgi:hypothetical protein
MIPSLNTSGVLPPFLGTGPEIRASVSPYEATMSELVRRFATSTERVQIFRGLLDLREEIRAVGITNGFQLIDGSFVEDVESIRGRPPGDVDVVTLAYRANPDPNAWKNLVQNNLRLFDTAATKAQFRCDAYYIDMNKRPDILVEDAVYFFNLFSHQKATFLWKGMLRISLISDDQLARSML